MPTINVRWADNTATLRENLKQGVNQIEATRASVEKMVKALSGDNLIAAAHKWTAAIAEMGGVQKLTTAEVSRANDVLQKAIEKYTLLGKVAPQALRDLAAQTAQASKAGESWASWLGKANTLLGGLGIGLSLGALTAFGKSLLANADALVKMSDKTGVSITGLQRLQAAGDDAGNSLDQLTSAVSQMQNRLASGDSSAVAALKQLGLTLDDLKGKSPDQQFMQLGDAIASVADPARRTQIAMDLFGRAGAEVLPTLVRGFDDVKDAAVGMSEETARALDKIGDDLTRTGRVITRWSAEALVAIVGLAKEGFVPFGSAASDAAQAGADFFDELARMAKKIPEAKKDMAGLFEPILSDGVEARHQLEESNKILAAIDASARKAEAALRKMLEDRAKDALDYQIALEKLGAALYAIENPARDIVHRMHDLTTLGVSVKVDDWVASFKKLRDTLSDIERQGIPAVFTQGGLPGVGTAVDDIERLKNRLSEARNGLSDLAQAFAQLAQISGGSFGGIIRGIGTLISSIDVANTAMKNLERASASTLSKLASYATVVGVFWEVGRGFQNWLDQFEFMSHANRDLIAAFTSLAERTSALTGGFATGADMVATLTEAFIASGMKASDAEARVRSLLQTILSQSDGAAEALTEVEAALARLAAIKAGASQFGPSKEEAAEAARLAQEIFDYMLKSGQYTQEQLEAAYYAWQKAMAAAGDAAAAAWVKAHDAAKAATDAGTDGAVQVSAAMQALLDQKKSLEDSLAKEAPEEFIGSIEQQQRDQLDAVNAQIEAMQRQAEEAAASAEATSKATGDAATDAGDTVTDELGGAIVDTASEFDEFGPKARAARSEIEEAFRTLSITIPVHFGVDSTPTVGSSPSGTTAPSGRRSTGIVPWDMDGLTGPRGADRIPVWMSEGETVRTPQQDAALMAGRVGAESGDVSVVVNFNGPVFAEDDYIERKVAAGVMRGIERGGKTHSKFTTLVRQVQR